MAVSLAEPAADVDPDLRPDTDRRRPARALLIEGAAVAALLVFLELLVFRSYVSGAVIPPADFVSHYNTDAFAWWRDGGFFTPAQWMAYMWGGYPAALDIQNSSWYLPVGVVAELVTYDLRAAAAVSAAHVAFGALGMYVLARRYDVSPAVASIGLIAWFFVGPFYANSQHLDIMRAYAWLPWLLLCLSPRWPWRRWWAVLLGGLMLWQGLLSMYPGIVIAGVYCLPAWILGNQLLHRPRLTAYLLPMALTTAAAGALTALRYLPYLLIRGTGSPRAGDSSVFSWELLTTSVYPYAVETFPNDVSMRSFFVTAPVVCALAVVAWRRGLTRIAASVAVVATLLGVPMWPWSPFVAELPGLGISRFRMSDFKVYLLAMLVLAAVVAVAELVRRAGAAPGAVRGSSWPALRALAVLVALATAVGHTVDYPTRGWLAQWALVVASAAALAALSAIAGSDRVTSVLGRRGPAHVSTALVVALAAATGLSGYLSASGTPGTWRMDRVAHEAASYGGDLTEIVAGRRDAGAEIVRRPARTVPPGEAPYDASELFAVSQNRAHYSGDYSVAGYVNLYGTGSFDNTVINLVGEASVGDALAFWAAPGLGIVTPDGEIPPAALTTACAEGGRCGAQAEITPVGFEPAGRFEYEVQATDDVPISFNEAFYPGWSAQACEPTGGGCVDVATRAGGDGQILAEVPAGSSRVTLTYVTPGQPVAWALFAVGMVTLLVLAAFTAVSARASSGRAGGHRSPVPAGVTHPSSAPSRPNAADAGSGPVQPRLSGGAPP